MMYWVCNRVSEGPADDWPVFDMSAGLVPIDDGLRPVDDGGWELLWAAEPAFGCNFKFDIGVKILMVILRYDSVAGGFGRLRLPVLASSDC